MLALGVAAALAATAACGDDDATTMVRATPPPSTPTAPASTPTTVAPTQTAAPVSPTATPAVTATSPVEAAARSAGSFLYKSRPGDTVLKVAQYFNGQPGTAKAGFPDQIRELNHLGDGDIPAGAGVVVPLIRTGADLIPGAGIAAAIKPSGSSPLPVVFTPGHDLTDRVEGRIALHRVDLAAGGYQLEFWLTDKPPVSTTGATDASAVVKQRLFTIAAGPFADALPADSPTVARFEREGVHYAVSTEGTLVGTVDVAAGLVPAQIRPWPAR